MWKLLTICSAFGLLLSVIATEVARDVYSRRRSSGFNHGGTQDIALLGMILGVVCLGTMIVSAIMWALS
jgi:hypothetical protein